MSAVAEPAAARFLVVFTGAEAPPDFSGRVAALGGVVDTIFDDVGFAVASGLTQAAAQQLRSAAGVRAVEPDLILGAEDADEPAAADLAGADATEVVIESSDAPTGAAFYSRQWNLRAIGADVAWAAGLLGESSVRVAILDTGIDYLHDDLVGRVDLSRSTSLLHLSQSCPTTDPGQPSSNEDDVVRSTFPGRELFTDLHSHGTGVAALIASNARWLAGVTQRTTLFSVKVHDRFRRNCVSVYLAGIIYAADHGADVIHLSIPLEFSKDSFPGIVAAVDSVASYAHRKGAVMVAAAGNDSADLDHDGTRFKFCNAVHVICVAATGPTSAASLDGPWKNVDAVAPYTAFGRSTINVAGPGGTGNPGAATTVWLVCSQTTLVMTAPQRPCRMGQKIWSSTGTSFGAAATSGLAALLVSTMGQGHPDQIRAAIEQSADDLGDPGTDPYYGRGRINVARAVGAVDQPRPAPLVLHVVAPQTTDPAIDRALDDHYVWLDTTARSNHKLFLFMPGANAIPRQFQLVEQEAARLGYHVIGLMYPNSVNLVGACSGVPDPNTCYENSRLEILDGTPLSSAVDVDTANSIDNRLTKLLQHLIDTYPDEGWSRFLADGKPKWSQIAVGGHSQGGGQAAMIAKLHVVARVALFSAVPDRIGIQSVTWVATHITPSERYWGLAHDRDGVFLPSRASWDSLGMAAFGPAVAPETSEPPYGFTHVLVTDLTPQGGFVGTKAHMSTVFDDVPLLNADGTRAPREVWWRYLLTAREPDESSDED